MDKRISKELTDRAERTDEGSVMKKSRLRQYIRNRFDTEDETKQAIAVSKYRKGTISRRDFLKMLGLAGTGVIATTIGYGILPEQSTRLITGQQTGGCNPEIVQVPSGSVENITNPEEASGTLFDITSSNSGVHLDIFGTNWTLENIGVRGELNPPGDDNVNIMRLGATSRDSTCTVRNIYMGDGSHTQSNRGGIFVGYGERHHGIIEFENMHVANMYDNGLYATAVASENGNPGVCHVRNSYFYYNDVANIRVPGDEIRGSGEGSLVENCHIEAGNVDGIQAERGTVRVRDCHVVVENARRALQDMQGPSSPRPEDGGSFDVENTQCQPAGNDYCTGSDANPQPPSGVPMSAEEAACGTSTAGGGGKITQPSVDEWTSITLTGGSSSNPAEYIIKADELQANGTTGQIFGDTATGSLTSNSHQYQYRGRLLDLTTENGITVQRAGEELSTTQLLNLICG